MPPGFQAPSIAPYWQSLTVNDKGEMSAGLTGGDEMQKKMNHSSRESILSLSWSRDAFERVANSGAGDPGFDLHAPASGPLS